MVRAYAEVPDGVVYHGDCVAVLGALPERSVHCVISSPPYYALRAYSGVEPSVWGGDPRCEHGWMIRDEYHNCGDSSAGEKQKSNVGAVTGRGVIKDATCVRCGALRCCLGLEPTPFCWAFTRGENCGACYLCHLRTVMAAVWRVLRDDGTAWINLGDSYSGSGKGPTGHNGIGDQAERQGFVNDRLARYHGDLMENGSKGARIGSVNGESGHTSGVSPAPGTKAKDLLLIPELFALAMRSDGWYVRQRHLGCKTACMPESVTDRATSAVEYVWHLAKAPRYFYDEIAGREASNPEQEEHNRRYAKMYDFALSHDGNGQPANTNHVGLHARPGPGGRNQRNWFPWTPDPFPGAHFAVFPRDLVRRFLVVATSERGCCAACGAPYRRVVDRTSPQPRGDAFGRKIVGEFDHGQAGAAYLISERVTTGWMPSCSCGLPPDCRPDDLEIIDTPTGERAGDDPTMFTGRKGMNRPRGADEGSRPITRYEQRRYADQLRASPHRAEMANEAGPAFDHYLRTDRSGARPIPPDLLDAWIDREWLVREEPPRRPDGARVIPCTVLDPFAGSGTTLVVAREIGRRFIGIDASRAYVEMALRRLEGVPLNFASAPVAAETIDDRPRQARMEV